MVDSFFRCVINVTVHLNGVDVELVFVYFDELN